MNILLFSALKEVRMHKLHFASEIRVRNKWVKVFKNGPSKICGRQPLQNFTWSILEYLDPDVTPLLYLLFSTTIF